MNPSAPISFPSGLYALCDDGFLSAEAGLSSIDAQVARLLAGGVKVLQLRMKKTPVREAVAQARSAVVRCRKAGVVCLINDRVDIALLSGAHGVHVGDEDLLPADARKILGERAIIGVTVRDAEMARAAQDAGASYVGAGPVFRTTSKVVSAPVMGMENLRRLVQDSPLPVVGIGGIGLTNIEEVAASGVHGAAVLSDVLQAANPSARAEELARAFLRGSERA